MKLLVLVIVCLAVAAKEVSSQACHLREVDLCMAISMFHYQSNGIPADEEKVDEWCETLKEVYECMGNFSAKCLSPLQKEVISLFAGSDDAATKLCTPGSELRAKYLKSAQCLSEAAESETFKGHIRDLQVSLEAAFDAVFSKRLPTLCCGFKRFDMNTGKSTEEICGPEAVSMTRNMMRMITTELPETICQRYDTKSDECMSLLKPVGTKPSGSASNSQIAKLLDTVFGNM